MTPQTAYPEGKVSVPVTLTNTGQLDETLMVSYSLQPSALTQTKAYFVPKTGNVTDTLYFDLVDGEYQLTAVSSQPTASPQPPFQSERRTRLNSRPPPS